MRNLRVEVRLTEEEARIFDKVCAVNRRTRGDTVRYLIMSAYEFLKLKEEATNMTATTRKSR